MHIYIYNQHECLIVAGWGKSYPKTPDGFSINSKSFFTRGYKVVPTVQTDLLTHLIQIHPAT